MHNAEEELKQAAQFLQDARRWGAESAWERAATAYDAAVLRYGELTLADGEDKEATPLPESLLFTRASGCREYGDVLTYLARYAEAANVFQEASDVYNLVSGKEAQETGRECAQRALASIAALSKAGQERLYLLIVRYERQQRQLALRPHTFRQQAECCVHIAQIFARRDRPQEATRRYQNALTLYAQAPEEPATCLAQAECHHRLGGLLANSLQDVPETTLQAIRHYEQAIALYTASEPVPQDALENVTLCRHALMDLKWRLNS